MDSGERKNVGREKCVYRKAGEGTVGEGGRGIEVEKRKGVNRDCYEQKRGKRGVKAGMGRSGEA